MKFLCISIAIITTSLLTGCGTTSQTTSQIRKITSDEAFSFTRVRANQNTTPPQKLTNLYIQPVNKSEPCKLNTSQNQLDRNNFRAYWDGKCKNGFAYGLGRDIAISDTHHLEEITIYGNDGKINNSPAVTYDFVHNSVNYRFIGNQPLENSFFNELIINEAENFSINYEFGMANGISDVKIIYWSPLSAQKTFVNIKNDVVYKYTENQLPSNTNSTNPVFLSETLDKNSGVSGGFAAARYANGQVRHFKLTSDKPEVVNLPQDYISEIDIKYKEIINIQTKVSKDIEKAKIMEKEYLYLACNGKHKISGLDKSIANKICTWRDQFQEPLKISQSKYNNNLEKMKSDARSQEEQRRVQEQLDYQKRMTQAVERQASAAEDANFQNSLNRNKTTTCYSNFGITTCY